MFNENAASEHFTQILDINVHISDKALEPFITSYIALGGIVCRVERVYRLVKLARRKLGDKRKCIHSMLKPIKLRK